MRTDKQIEASKTNGAKSQRPKTPDGKAKFAKTRTLLSNVSIHEFKAFSNGYYDAFAPANRSSGISSTN